MNTKTVEKVIKKEEAQVLTLPQYAMPIIVKNNEMVLMVMAPTQKLSVIVSQVLYVLLAERMGKITESLEPDRNEMILRIQTPTPKTAKNRIIQILNYNKVKTLKVPEMFLKEIENK